MKAGWIIGIVMAFVLLQVVMGIAELSTASLEEGDVSKLQTLTELGAPTQAGFVGFVVGAVSMVFSAEFYDILWEMFMWQYPSIFIGAYELLRYAFFLPVSVGVVVSLLLAAVRGVSG